MRSMYVLYSSFASKPGTRATLDFVGLWTVTLVLAWESSKQFSGYTPTNRASQDRSSSTRNLACCEAKSVLLATQTQLLFSPSLFFIALAKKNSLKKKTNRHESHHSFPPFTSCPYCVQCLQHGIVFVESETSYSILESKPQLEQ